MGEKEGTVIIAEEQTEGRGRLGKNWTSPKGKGIWLSIILRPNINPTDASKLTQIGAAAVWKGINQLGIEALIKWPNDIVVNGKKVSGILTEMSGELNKINYLVIGIGVNVNLESRDFPEDIREIATSLKAEKGTEISRENLLAEILNNFEEFYEELIERNTISKAIKICRDKSVLLGRNVKIISKGMEVERKAVGITDEGELLIEDANGKIEKVISGEISVRGVFGYV